MDPSKRQGDSNSARLFPTAINRATPMRRGETSGFVAEQRPVMRSVSMALQQQHSRGLQSEHSEGTPSFSFRQSPLGFGSLSPKLDSFCFDIRLPPKSKSASVPMPTTAHRRWDVDGAKLERPPNDFPLARTSRAFPGVKAEVLAARISRCLRTRSIRAVFSEAEQQQPLATCRNLDFVKFHVRLFGGSGGGEGGSVIVEVRRMCGDCISFMRDYRAIIDFCGGGGGGEQLADLKPTKPSLHIPRSIFEMRIPNETAPKSLQIAAELLSKERVDANMLGIQSLALLSDVTKTFKATSLLCSKRILRSEEDGNDGFDIHKCLMHAIVHSTTSANFTLKTHVDQNALGEYEERFRNLALCSISNALGLLLEDGSLYQTIASNQDWFIEVLIPRLVEDIAAAHDHPHEACYASRCLSCLAASSPVFAEKIKRKDIILALMNAEQVGKYEFALLASYADSCRNEIINCC